MQSVSRRPGTMARSTRERSSKTTAHRHARLAQRESKMLNKNCLARGWAFLAAFASVGLTGCASIVGGTNQIVSVEARQLDRVRMVRGAACELSNDKGVYYVTTPGTVTVMRFWHWSKRVSF
jgi:uncharacterized membrane protein